MKRLISQRTALPAVLIVSAILRFALCARYVSGDETRILKNAIHFFSHHTLMPTHFNYPTLFSYLAAAPIRIGATVLKMRGAIASLPFLFDLHANDSVLPILPARITSAIFGVLTILVLFKIGERCCNRETGLVAAAILGFSNIHNLYSGYAFPDATMTFFATCALFFSLSALESESLRDYILAGVFAGLAAATKYNGAFILLVIVCVHFVARGDTRKLLSFRYHRRMMLCLFAFMCAFVLGTPGWIIRPNFFWNALMYERRHMIAGDVYDVGIPYIRQVQVFWKWETTTAVLFALGLLYALYRRKKMDTVMLVVVAACFIYIGSLGKKDIHYMLFLFPVLCLLSARMLNDARAALKRAPVVLGTLLIVIALAWPAYKAFSQAAEQLLEDNRWTARRWIHEHIAANARIVIDWAYVPKLNRSRHLDSRALWDTRSRRQGKNTRDGKRYALFQLDYDLTFLEEVEAEYLLTSSGCYDRYIDAPSPSRSPEHAAYHRLKDTYSAILFDAESHGWRLLKRFDAGKGPVILLYERLHFEPSEPERARPGARPNIHIGKTTDQTRQITADQTYH